jgi:hypothetical protein
VYKRQPVHLVVSIALFFAGLRSNTARPRSYGIGALAFYGMAALAVLLFFGTCLLTLGQFGT